MAIDPQLLDEIRKNECREVILFRSELTDADAIALAKALACNESVLRVNLYDNQISDEGIQALVPVLAKHPAVRVLYLGKNAFGDAGALAIADLVCKNRRITDLNLSENTAITDAVIVAFDDAVISSGHKNIKYCAVDNLLSDPDIPPPLSRSQAYGILNGDRAVELESLLLDAVQDQSGVGFGEHIKAKDICDIFARFHAVNSMLPEQWKSTNALAQLFRELPTVDLLQPFSLADLVTPLFGLKTVPLDNPLLWQEIAYVAECLAAKGTPFTKEFLMQPNKDGDPYIVSGIYSERLPEILAALNVQGEAITKEDLLGVDGKPTPLLEAMIEANQVCALLNAKDNWRGRPFADVRAIYRALPESSQRQVHNWQSIAAKMRPAPALNPSL